MLQLMIAAPRSGSGKTTVTCALLRALQKRALAPCAFKCGPDYIDPMFHRAVLGVETRNLDLFLSDEACVRELYTQGCQGHGAAVVEGVMGYYDGLGGVSDRASAWHIADALEIPVLLVIRAKGASLTLAAEIKGLVNFRENSHIAGVLLNECPPKLYETLSPVLERESGVPVLGYLSPIEEARIESRHLGLRTAGEIGDLGARLDLLGQELEAHLDWARFERLFMREAPHPSTQKSIDFFCKVRIAIGNDKVFCFTYGEALNTLRRFGAELVPFSPLEDTKLPDDIGGLYLPGGYPELYARALFDNQPMRESIKKAVQNGLPTVAECGGFLYLGEILCDELGREHPMAGVLPGKAANTGHLARFGYQTLCAESDSLLFRRGERIPAHEFHYWDSTDCGGDLIAEKGMRRWRCGFVSDTLYAAFPHLYVAGRPELAERFVEAARRYQEGK